MPLLAAAVFLIQARVAELEACGNIDNLRRRGGALALRRAAQAHGPEQNERRAERCPTITATRRTSGSSSRAGT